MEEELLLKALFASKRTAELVVHATRHLHDQGETEGPRIEELKERYDVSMSTVLWVDDILEFEPQREGCKTKLYG